MYWEVFLGIYPRKDIRVEKVEVDLQLGDKEESTTVVEVWEVKELLGLPEEGYQGGGWRRWKLSRWC